MSKFQEVLVSAILPAIKEVGKAELTQVFAGIKEHNTAEVYKNTLQGLHSDFALLKDAAIKTKTKIDDGLVDLVLEAVQEKAEADGIVLT